MKDLGHEETERLIKRMTADVQKVYLQASKEVQAKLDDYFRRFEIKDEIWARKVANGEAKQEDYIKWRQSQLMVGQRWETLQQKLSEELHQSNVTARKLVDQYRAEAYAVNFNYGTFLVETQSKIDTAFTLYNREAVERIIREEPELLPPPGFQSIPTKFDRYKAGEEVKLTAEEKKAFDVALAADKDIRWQKGQIQSVTMQAIVQGESIPNFAKRIARDMGEINHKSTIRYARTAMTGAQNAGRVDSFHRAEELGIDMEQVWVSVLDGRTRYEHRQLDGMRVKVGEPFKVDGYTIMFPGDPSAPPEMVYNCRCGVWAQVKGWKTDLSRRSLADLDGMSYDEWKNSHKEQSRSITYQEEVGNAMKWKYINERYK